VSVPQPRKLQVVLVLVPLVVKSPGLVVGGEGEVEVDVDDVGVLALVLDPDKLGLVVLLADPVVVSLAVYTGPQAITLHSRPATSRVALIGTGRDRES
jgi:hypothetical protein